MGQPTAIYILRDPRNGYARYVGRSVDPARRMEEHIGNPLRQTGAWIVELREKKLAPTMHIMQWVDEKDAEYTVFEWIHGCLTAGAPLLYDDSGEDDEHYNCSGAEICE